MKPRTPSHILRSLSVVFCLITANFLALPSAAWAVQIHGAPEGLYVHNMAHVFFSAALVFLLYLLHKNPLGYGPAWRYLKLSFLFFLIWNFDTFTVHLLSVRLPSDAILRTPEIWNHKLLPPITWERWLYYAGTFDHLLCVPAICFLVLSLKHFCNEAEQKIRSMNKAKS